VLCVGERRQGLAADSGEAQDQDETKSSSHVARPDDPDRSLALISPCPPLGMDAAGGQTVTDHPGRYHL
jgi:hypothetical protein